MDKTGLRFPGGTMIHRVLDQVEGLFDEILISVSRGQTLAGLKHIAVEDETPGLGPLAGILAGLKKSRNDVCAVLACDIPDIHTDLLATMVKKARSYEIVVPVSSRGFIEPLFAVYSKTVIPEIEAIMADGFYSIRRLFERCRTRKVRMKDSGWLRNLNTPEDYQNFLQSLETKRS